MQSLNFEAQKSEFQKILKRSRAIVVSTGAGVSAESGVPTFRGENGLWKKYDVTMLATVQAFLSKPELVWEFYNFRRKLVEKIEPNSGHFALTKLEEQCIKKNKLWTLITQNVDGLHSRAGSRNVLEIHGNLHKIKCSKCSFKANFDEIPISQNFIDLGSDSFSRSEQSISIDDLPKCSRCKALLRPDIVWFGEMLNPALMEQVDIALSFVDLFIAVGTSLQVYPAAAFPMTAKMNGAKIALVNNEKTGYENQFDFVFIGKSGEILPEILNIEF